MTRLLRRDRKEGAPEQQTGAASDSIMRVMAGQRELSSAVTHGEEKPRMTIEYE
jgi:hypothetical protein